jgi:hypothetical protein
MIQNVFLVSKTQYGMRTIVIKLSILFLFFSSSHFLIANDEFDFKTPVKRMKGKVKKLNEDLTVIVSEDESRRFVVSNLPDEFNKNDLKVRFSGLEAAPPPYMKLAGTPLKLTKISISPEQKRLFDLGKKSYRFKK